MLSGMALFNPHQKINKNSKKQNKTKTKQNKTKNKQTNKLQKKIPPAGINHAIICKKKERKKTHTAQYITNM
jgi:hypothetical protein